jgi:hypothetical protein
LAAPTHAHTQAGAALPRHPEPLRDLGHRHPGQQPPGRSLHSGLSRRSRRRSPCRNPPPVARRPLLPGAACQRCHELIDPAELSLEAQPGSVREQARYARDVPAPAVMTLNTIAAGRSRELLHVLQRRHAHGRGRPRWPHPPSPHQGRDRQRAASRTRCRSCSTAPGSALALGDARPVLPSGTRQR